LIPNSARSVFIMARHQRRQWPANPQIGSAVLPDGTPHAALAGGTMQTGQQPNQPADKREVVELSSRPSNKPRCGTTPAMTPRR